LVGIFQRQLISLLDNNIEIFEIVTGMVTIEKEQLEKIKNRLPELYRGKALIGHSTSQASYSLQTMTMISDSPFARMKQCLAQISKRKDALQESYFKMETRKLENKKLQFNNDEESMLKIKENEALNSSISVSMENSLRQIGLFQDMYDDIRMNNNIPENWSEKDFESQEISHMIRSSFRMGIQDIMAGNRVSKASVEYWEQLGIHPQLAELKTRNYINNTQEILLKLGEITIKLMYDFLDDMAKEFSESYKLALIRIGVNELGSEEFMANGGTKPQ